MREWSNACERLAPRTAGQATRRTFLVLAGALLGRSATLATAGGGDGEDEPEASKERLEGMRRLAQGVKLVEAAEGKSTPPVPLRTEPLQRYSNRPLGILDGTLWAWGGRGRPLAILKVELWPDRDDGRGRWSFGISATSPGLITVKFRDGLTWSSRRPGIDPQAMPDSSEPAGAPAQRLIQAKELSRRLKAHGEHPKVPGKIDLRLLPTPIHRYADPEVGLLDGLVFAFVSATNPETFVFFEAWTPKGGTPGWRYGFARLGTSGVTVEDGGRVAWTVPYAPPPSNTETYMNRSLPKGVEKE